MARTEGNSPRMTAAHRQIAKIRELLGDGVSEADRSGELVLQKCYGSLVVVVRIDKRGKGFGKMSVTTLSAGEIRTPYSEAITSPRASSSLVEDIVHATAEFINEFHEAQRKCRDAFTRIAARQKKLSSVSRKK